MLQLKGVSFIRAALGLAALNGSLAALKRLTQHQDHDPVTTDTLVSVEEETTLLIEVLKDLEAPTALAAAERLIRGLQDPKITLGAFSFLIGHLFLSLKTEFGAQSFFALSSNEARFFFAAEPPFGPEVQAKFSDSVSEDTREASKCIACSRYTASVFHLMRVLEVGVGQFAGLLGVQPLDKRGKDKNWQNFLDETDKAIRQLPTQDLLTKKYAAISANLYSVKVAWRNEVMHPKQSYTEEQALEVFAASKAFMRELASVL